MNGEMEGWEGSRERWREAGMGEWGEGWMDGVGYP